METPQFHEHLDEMLDQVVTRDELYHEMKLLFEQELQNVVGKGDIMPRIYVLTPPYAEGDKVRMSIYLLANEDFNEEKYSIVRTIGRDCVYQGLAPKMVFFFGEAWLRNFTKEEADKFMKTRRQVADYQDRKEGVFMAAMSVQGDQCAASAIFERSRKGNIKSLEEPEYFDQKRAGGDLLPHFWIGVRDAAKVVIEALEKRKEEHGTDSSGQDSI